MSSALGANFDDSLVKGTKSAVGNTQARKKSEDHVKNMFQSASDSTKAENPLNGIIAVTFIAGSLKSFGDWRKSVSIKNDSKSIQKMERRLNELPKDSVERKLKELDIQSKKDHIERSKAKAQRSEKMHKMISGIVFSISQMARTQSMANIASTSVGNREGRSVNGMNVGGMINDDIATNAYVREYMMNNDSSKEDDEPDDTQRNNMMMDDMNSQPGM